LRVPGDRCSGVFHAERMAFALGTTSMFDQKIVSEFFCSSSHAPSRAPDAGFEALPVHRLIFRKCGILNAEEGTKSAAYGIRTKVAQCGGLETKGPRERISGLGRRVAVLRFERVGPPLLGFSSRLRAQRECCTRTGWRRECDWDPTVSEFVARILLGRVRLGSNSHHRNHSTSRLG
jgi:hypothetical protein